MTRTTRTITIDDLQFIVAPEPAQPTAPVETPKRAKPKSRRHAPAPQCIPSRSVRCSDGLHRMNYLAERFEREKKKGRLERWGIWKTFEE